MHLPTKKLLVSFLLISFSLAAQPSLAAKKAVTDDGKVVFLNDDGTWFYIPEQSLNIFDKKYDLSDTEYVKNSSSNFLVKSKKNNSAIWIDPKQWSFGAAVNNPTAEYEFAHNDGDLYAMLITERIEIPKKKLIEAFFNQVQKIDANPKIGHIDLRSVNGKEVYFVKCDAVVQGIPYTYNSYFYSDSLGTTQLITYTATNLVDQYSEKIDALLNGLTDQE